MEAQSEKIKKTNPVMQWLTAITVSFAILQYGAAVGWMSAMTKVLQSVTSPSGHSLSEYEMSWIASALCITATIGVPIFAYIVDRFGRKTSLVIVSVFQLIGWTIKLCSAVTISLVIARLCLGFATAGCYTTIPIYVKEISEDRIRGILGSFFTLGMFMGTLIMFTIGAYLDYYSVLWIIIGLSSLTTLMMIRTPESPAFLVKKDKIDQAASTLAYLRRLDVNDKVIQNEIAFMKNEELTYKSLPKISFKSILKTRPWRYGLLLIMTLMTLSTNSGNFAILTYGTRILKAAGTTMDPDVQMISFPAISMFGSVVSMSCVERFGRKPILITTYILATASLGVLATCIMVMENGGSFPSVVPLLSIWVYLFSYAGGIQAMSFIILAEMFNFQIRAKIIGVIMTYGWMCSFIHLKTYAPLTEAFGIPAVFYGYAIINFIGVVVNIVFLPETKGKTVEQIEKELSKK